MHNNNTTTSSSDPRIISFSINKQSLLEKFKPSFFSKNKVFLYSLHSDDQEYEGDLIYSRFRTLTRPKSYDHNDCNTKVNISSDIFQYNEELEGGESTGASVKHWYLNFADSQLFIAWKGQLFAQDEIQVCEHPILGSLCEYLRRESLQDERYSPITQKTTATPVLIQNVDRRCAVNVTDYNIYGNNFAKASTDLIQKATTVLDMKTTRRSNILAISAPRGGHGEYKLGEINFLFDTLYSGFKACCLESEKNSDSEQLPTTVVIHTGNFGSGAFGNNRELVAIIQILAARLAGVKYLYYHAFDNEGVKAVNRAIKVLDEEFNLSASASSEENNVVSLNKILDLLLQKGYKWGYSDGN